MTQIVWVTPLLLMPGIGLLIMSTSARFGQLHLEFDRLTATAHSGHWTFLAEELMRRAEHFRSALVSLYLSIACLGLAGLTGGFLDLLGGPAQSATMVLTCLSIFLLLFALGHLIVESFLLLGVLRDDLEHGLESARSRDHEHSLEDASSRAEAEHTPPPRTT